MANTVTNTNTGPNFLDWERNLMIVLRHERKWYVLDEPLGEAPPANATATVRNAHKKHSDDLLDVGCLMLATMSPDLQTGLINTNAYDMIRQLRDMFETQARTERYDATKAFNECKMIKGTSVSDHVMKMKRHMDHLERLGHPVSLQLATDTILNSLSDDYKPFVINYNMNNMEKTIAELHSMLKTAELNMGAKNKTKDVLLVRDGGVKKKHGHGGISKGKGPVQAIQNAPKVRENGKGKGKGKKVKPNKARTENRCFTCNEVGHWRQNCPKRHEADKIKTSETCQLGEMYTLSDFRKKSLVYTATKESCSFTLHVQGSWEFFQHEALDEDDIGGDKGIRRKESKKHLKAHPPTEGSTLRDFKFVSEYNSAMFRITFQLTLCDEKITDEEMLEKTFSTFHASNMLLQQQYCERGFKKYCDLISCLLVAKQNNELLMKNHETRTSYWNHPIPRSECGNI
ncbi:hypothetical protein OSB04_012036 [Centaurea solstitialis]|uniref:CCHC-type domain-containing protein n=1 Tax=Centaurea solstitialis TaxID=347529 RepID=A0AA38WDK8_9ASTR|nr:hypothetical protein OSB04_012036 [Centaurea solstitialis]